MGWNWASRGPRISNSCLSGSNEDSVCMIIDWRRNLTGTTQPDQKHATSRIPQATKVSKIVPLTMKRVGPLEGSHWNEKSDKDQAT